jgi:serine/threonine protein phosphatase PrpC
MSISNPDSFEQPGVTPYSVSPDFPPLSALVRVDFGAQSRRGLFHSVNEDHYLIIELGRHQKTLLTSLPEAVVAKRFEEFGYGMIVADGFGGTGTGESASRLALSTLVHLMLHFGKWNLRIDDQIAREVLARAERFYRHVDSAVVHQSTKGPVTGLQTTLTAVFGAGRDLFFAHVGHSRAYLFRKGHLLRLTHDHTIGRRHASTVPVAALVDVNAAARDLKHIILETIGMSGGSGPTIDLERFQVDDDDRVLLCTNGLTDMVDEDAIAVVLGKTEPSDEQCRKLVDLAVAAGGEDDVTVLVGHYHVPG